MKVKNKRNGEKGAALAVALIILAILTVVSMTALTFSASEARIAGQDLRRSQSFYAAVSGIEKMTSDFSDLFRRKIQPTTADLAAIANDKPAALQAEGFDFDQNIVEDAVKLAELREKQGISSQFYPRVNIPDGPYAGLFASIIPYKMTSKVTANQGWSGAQVKLERDFNNYLVPLFQFAIFSNEDLEFAPGNFLTVNGRIHSNKNIYALRNTKFLSRVTAAGELVRNATRGGNPNSATGNNNVWIEVGGVNVNIDKGSVENGGGSVGGPNILGTTVGMRGFHPGSPAGTANPSWESTSVLPADGTPGKFGGQISTQTTGGAELKLPIQLEGNSPNELIKRNLPIDSTVMQSSRYQGRSVVRILIDDEAAGSGSANVAGIPVGKGVQLATFIPIPLDSGNALRRVNNSGAYIDSDTIKQKLPDDSEVDARVVRGLQTSGTTVSGNYIPRGAGFETLGRSGKILIEITKPDGTTVDVTQQILSMGMTEGEPNGIVYLQRPLWAAYLQGSRDRLGSDITLVNMTNNTQTAADGEIKDNPSFDASRGFIKSGISSLNEDGGDIIREKAPKPSEPLNAIVPINVYNVREGWFKNGLDEKTILERGITSVVEINMKNLSRWLDGVYDANLLNGTLAVSSNIKGDEGYVVYFSDRRGDSVKVERTTAAVPYNSTNGTVDNEDIYGPNNVLDEGEDVIDTGWDSVLNAPKANSLQKDITELPDTGVPYPLAMGRPNRASLVMSWTNPNNYFRRSLRLFNGETLSTTATSGKLSPTKGLTIASENMVYVWGNYNTTGVSSIPAGGSTLNNGTGYTGPQIPASIACDAIFPLSKTWFDGISALYPEGSSTPMSQNGDDYRRADANLPDVTQSTSVRAAVLAGTTKSVASGFPGRDGTGNRGSGGAINFPRFLEIWNLNGTTSSWNYAGSFVPLFTSTQAVSQWENNTSVIYMPPRRNWSFDLTFRNPSQIPPGTPFFQYIAVTSFRQNLKN
jgi:hypothetical protein